MKIRRNIRFKAVLFIFHLQFFAFSVLRSIFGPSFFIYSIFWIWSTDLLSAKPLTNATNPYSSPFALLFPKYEAAIKFDSNWKLGSDELC